MYLRQATQIQCRGTAKNALYLNLPAIDGAALANAEERTQSGRKFIKKFIS